MMAGAGEPSEQIVPGENKQQSSPKLNQPNGRHLIETDSGVSTKSKGAGYASSKGAVKDGGAKLN